MGNGESNTGAWYRSLGGVGILTIDLVLVLALVAGTTQFGGDVVGNLTGSDWTATTTVPWYVYLYGALGATGYVFTMLVREFGRSGTELARHNLRIPAALPLAAGVYLLSERFVGGDSVELLAALAFATGLLVNTAYLRIRDLSVRLLSTSEGENGEGVERDGDDGPDDEGGDGNENDGSGPGDDTSGGASGG